jgi:serine/threonine protein phosphatase PrpC
VAPLSLRTAARTHRGLVRDHNEDAVLATPRLVMVADGVGGHAAGEEASQAAFYALAQLDKTKLDRPLAEALPGAVDAANATIGFVAGCRPETAGMATTVTAVAVERGYVIANAGDSRAYLWRAGELVALTRDDSLVQELLDRGLVSEQDARRHPQRSVVMNVLDGDPGRHAAVATHDARIGDRLLLCSDGLTDLVDEPALRVALAEPDRERCADRLVQLALAAGGRDNVSVIVADVVAAGDPADRW